MFELRSDCEKEPGADGPKQRPVSSKALGSENLSELMLACSVLFDSLPPHGL